MNHRQTFLQALFLFCQERNIDTHKVATLSGISIRELNAKKNFDMTNQQLENVWKNMVQLSGDELLGLHFGASMQIAALGAVGQIVQTSKNVKESLQQASSLIHLLTDFYTMELEETPKTFTVSFKKIEGYDRFSTVRNQIGDFLIAFTMHELKGLLLDNPKPLRAGLPTYKKLFDQKYENSLKCRTHKSEDHFLEFKKEYLQTKIITANHELQNLLLNQINKLQNPTFLEGGFSKKIFNFLIANSYLHSLSVEDVAGNFNVSVRTLQRRLKEEGVSYLQVMEEVRKSLAINYIQNSSSSVKEISNVLGYSEPSGFVRAFKKWTGKTPTTYRELSA